MSLNLKPRASYSIASRLLCVPCGKTPEKIDAKGIDPINITVHCHGQTETKVVAKEELVFTQRFFDTEEGGE